MLKLSMQLSYLAAGGSFLSCGHESGIDLLILFLPRKQISTFPTMSGAQVEGSQVHSQAKQAGNRIVLRDDGPYFPGIGRRWRFKF